MVIINLIGLIIGIFLAHSTAQAPSAAVNELSSPQTISQTVPKADSLTSISAVNQSTPAEKLAKCLTQKGVIMYGAYWCSHCANQKKDFGDAFQFVHYQECDDKGPSGNSEICQKAGIESYPTWIFPQHAKMEGEQSFEDLAKASACSLI